MWDLKNTEKENTNRLIDMGNKPEWEDVERLVK